MRVNPHSPLRNAAVKRAVSLPRLRHPSAPRVRQPAGRRAGDVAAVPVDMTGMLLRGTTLKNSGRITGLVVYTGPESRIQMNAAAPPRKRGARCAPARRAPRPTLAALTRLPAAAAPAPAGHAAAARVA